MRTISRMRLEIGWMCPLDVVVRLAPPGIELRIPLICKFGKSVIQREGRCPMETLDLLGFLKWLVSLFYNLGVWIIQLEWYEILLWGFALILAILLSERMVGVVHVFFDRRKGP